MPALVGALDDAHEQVRWVAAETLGHLGAEAKEAVPALKKLLKTDEDKDVREMAALALQEIEPASQGDAAEVLQKIQPEQERKPQATDLDHW